MRTPSSEEYDAWSPSPATQTFASSGRKRHGKLPSATALRLHLPQHLFDILELAEEPVHLRDRRPAPPGNPAPAAPVDDLRMPPLVRGHGVDHRLDASEGPFVDGHSAHARAEARDHPQQLVQGAHRPNLPELPVKSSSVISARLSRR